MLNNEQLPRPLKVTSALIIFYAWLFITTINTIISNIPKLSSSGFNIFKTFEPSQLLIIICLFFLIYMIGKGKNWARITFFILFIIGILSLLIAQYISTFIHTGGLNLKGIIWPIILLIGVILLFQKDSSEWFNKNRILKNSQHYNLK